MENCAAAMDQTGNGVGSNCTPAPARDHAVNGEQTVAENIETRSAGG
jgi:hypothetical protein